MVQSLRVRDSHLESDDTSAAAGKDGSRFVPKGFCDRNYITSLLNRVEVLIWSLHLAGGHLTTIECRDGVLALEHSHYRVILATMTIASGDEDEEGTGSLVPVVQIAIFIFNCCVCGVGRHFEFDKTKFANMSWSKNRWTDRFDGLLFRELDGYMFIEVPHDVSAHQLFNSILTNPGLGAVPLVFL